MCSTIEMNYCNDKHEPVYKITYKPLQPGGRSTEWDVCDWCYEKRFFSNPKDIRSITKLSSVC